WRRRRTPGPRAGRRQGSRQARRGPGSRLRHRRARRLMAARRAVAHNSARDLDRLAAAMTVSGEQTSVVEPHLRILHTVAQAVSGSRDVGEVLRTALDALTHVT